jgi:alpha-L-rhamnosidase
LTDGTGYRGEWDAKWCWPRKHAPRPWNQYVYFRRLVTLAVKPRTAEVRVSADARYTLYVNGKRVHHGPARSAAPYQSFDVLDLAPFLDAGTNVICAIAHQFGVPTFFSQYRDASGFILDGHAESPEETIDLCTPTDWLCHEALGWRKDVARLSVQMGFQEHFDADADPPDWMTASFHPTGANGWIAPWVIGPAGCHPWLFMEPRGIPLLTGEIENFVTVTAQFKGENRRGYKITSDVYGFLRDEVRTKERNLLEKSQNMLTDDGELTFVGPPTDSEFIMAVLDLGTIRTGHIVLDLAEALGDEMIDIILTEAVDKQGAPLLQGTVDEPTASEEATAFRYRCRPGRQQWESFHYVGFRYATIIFRNIEKDKPLQIRHIAVRTARAALDEAGSFECSDNRLNEVWNIARQTQLNCATDAMIDGPAREQAQWWGDARIQARVLYSGFGDVSLLERGLRQVARSQAADGSLHAHPPADIPAHRLPDFMMAWVATLHDFHVLTGRVDLLRECLPALHALMRFLKRHELPNRLIGNFEGFWVFIDWAPVHKANYSATLNLLYLQCLRSAAEVCEIAGDQDSADRYRAASETLAVSIDTHFWDAAGKLWRDGFDPIANTPLPATSQHANALGILLDLHSEAHLKIARDVLLKPANARRSKTVTASPFFYAYILEAMIHAGLREEAISVIREKWGGMIDQGAVTFWEYWEPTGSLCHAWAASPLYLLTQQVLGIRPIQPLWRRVSITPAPGKLEFARGTIPTPHGPIRVEWEHSGDDQLAVRIDLPEGVEAEFRSPLGEMRILGPGGHEFQT